MLKHFDQVKMEKKVRKEFDITLDTPVIGSISRIVYGKGHEDFIDAALLVLKEFPQAVFLIVGDGKYHYAKASRSSDIAGDTRKGDITGWRKDMLIF